jgi:hypothetical protein
LNLHKKKYSKQAKAQIPNGNNCPSGFVGDYCEIECGVTYYDQNAKIVGGTVANSNRFYLLETFAHTNEK